MSRPGLLPYKIAREMGLRVRTCIGLDLKYHKDGRFVIERHKKEADPADVVKRVKQLLNEGRMEAVGNYYEIDPDTLLVHGDNPKAIENLRVLRSELGKAGIKVSSFDKIRKRSGDRLFLKESFTMRLKMNYPTFIGSTLAAFLLFPFFLGSYFVHLLISIYCYATWRLLEHYGRLRWANLSGSRSFFCHWCLYFLASTGKGWFNALDRHVCGGVLSAIFGLLLGFVFFKYELKSHYFAVGTLAVGAVVRVIF